MLSMNIHEHMFFILKKTFVFKFLINLNYFDFMNNFFWD